MGKHNENDIIILEERVRDENHSDILTASIRIFSTVAEVVDYNVKRMAELPGISYIIKADNFTTSNYSFKPNIDKVWRVGDTQFINCLHLKLRSRLMLIHNICVMDGLANGATGELIGVEKRRDGTVDKLIIKFDKEHTGAETRNACPLVSSKYPGGNPSVQEGTRI